MNYDNILKSYNYASDNMIRDRIAKSSCDNIRKNEDILNMIVLWKTNRMVDVPGELLIRIRKLKIAFPFTELTKKELQFIVKELLSCNGVRLPMASTILKMFHPEFIPIIDQRAYRTLYKKERPKYYSKDANDKYVEVYIDYINKCHTFWEEECPQAAFEDVDKILYQMDINAGNTVKY